MIPWLSKVVDRLSEFFANRKGLLPILAILLAIINYILQLTTTGWVTDTNLLLHLSLIVGILGFMLARAL